MKATRPLKPAQPGVLIRLALAYLQSGREDEGFDALRRITEMEDAFSPPDGRESTRQDLLEMASFYLATVRAFDEVHTMPPWRPTNPLMAAEEFM